ncbi:MAG: CYTH domain-containing protein [Bacteroidales bacterium]|nr:CYTH domain-containing protein [Bacteroidales bacterium]
MAIEIERKFLIKDKEFLATLSGGHNIKQGYIALENSKIVRVRTKGNKAFLTIKSKIDMVSKYEFEYEIPFDDALVMIDTICIKPIIEKIRYDYFFKGYKWEIDIFSGVFKGIVIAEIEIENPNVDFPRPEWLGNEVTYDANYHNAQMVKRYNFIKKE